MDDTRLRKSQKVENQTGHLAGLQNVDAKVAHQHNRKTDTSDNKS